MIRFNNDYSEGCHPKILERLTRENFNQQPGYGEDAICRSAGDKIRKACGSPDADVHFLVGGTQTNFTVIAAALRPHQGVLSAVTGHINGHETGAVEATGHKVLPLPGVEGKISARQVRDYVTAHRSDSSFEHMVQPKMVYISNPTELGTIYSKKELEELSEACRELGLYLFLDGARLGYGLTAEGNDLTLADIARLTDVFYLGGTKVGALFGEAVVITNPELKPDFRYAIKQHGGMLAKGWLLGVQFDELLENNLYFNIAAEANRHARCIREALQAHNVPFLVKTTTNQLFPIFTRQQLEKLEQEFVFSPMEWVDANHRAVRICTSWATTAENTARLCQALEKKF